MKFWRAAQLKVCERQAVRLPEPNLHAKFIKQMVTGNIVIDQEVVTSHISRRHRPH